MLSIRVASRREAKHLGDSFLRNQDAFALGYPPLRSGQNDTNNFQIFARGLFPSDPLSKLQLLDY